MLTTRSLNECVGLPESSLTHSPPVRPSSSASRSARTSGVRPGSRRTRAPGSWPRGGADRGARGVPDGQQGDVAPDVLRPRLDLLAGHGAEQVLVVVDLERA